MCAKATVVEEIKPCCYQNKDKNRAQKPAGMAQLADELWVIDVNGNGRVVGCGLI